MHKIFKLLGLLILSIFFLSFPLKSAFADTVSLSGSVTTSIGAAVIGATIEVDNVNTTTAVGTATSNGLGSYNLNVPSGTYDIHVTPPAGNNYYPIVASSRTISSNTTINFVFAPAGYVTLSGHIYNSLGAPLPGQTVYVRPTSGGSQTTATTGSDGSYSLQVAPGLYLLDISATNNSSSLNAPQQYDIQQNNYSLTQSTVLAVTLPFKEVIVHTQDASGAPAGNIGISVSTPNGNSNSGAAYCGINGMCKSSYSTSAGLKTDATTGNATTWLFATTGSVYFYGITATPPTGSIYSTTIASNITIDSNTTLPIIMQQPVTLSGHLYNSFGIGLPNQTIYVRPTSGGSQTTTTTSADGSYSLQVTPGLYLLDISATNNNSSLNAPQQYEIQQNNFSLTQSTVLNINLPFKKVVIHTQDALGNPVGNMGISVTTPNGNSNSGSTYCGINGMCQSTYNTSAGLKTDATTGNATTWLFATTGSVYFYGITATPPTGSIYLTTTITNITLDTDTTVPLTMQQPVTLSGHIYDPLGFGLPGQTVSVKVSSGANPISTTTLSDGSYSLSVAPGTYILGISATNNSSSLNAPQQYDVSQNNYSLTQSTVLDVTMPFKKVIMHTQDALGNPVGNMGISVTTPNGNSNSGAAYCGINGMCKSSYSTSAGLKTDSNTGNATTWLFATTGSVYFYGITATPPTGSIYKTFTLSNVTVDGNQTELISLQYSHNTPVTIATLSPSPVGGTYVDPVTVTLSATAATGYNLYSPGGTYYTIDGGTNQTYTTPFIVTGAGSHTITYWSVDNSGVQELHNSKALTIVAPTPTPTIAPTATPTPTPIPTYSLSGIVYNDANQNGAQGDGEIGYSGATVTLDNGQSVTTGSDGSYAFTNLTAGAYEETLTVPTGYEATTANPVSVALSTDTTQNFGIAAVPTPTPTNTPTPTPTVTPTPALVLGINTGGDTQGSFVADEDYSGGQSYTSSTAVDTSNVTNPAPQSVYQTVRYGNFGYTIPNLTPNADYTVKLHFNELYWNSAGSRVFNVSINGQQALTNFDIYQAAGGSNKAIVEQFPTTADTNGNVTIQFNTVTDNAMVNGIELYSGTLPSPTPTPTPVPVSSIAVNAGGNSSSTFLSDQDFTGGQTYTSSDAVDTSGVLNPAPQSVYQSVRFGNFSYAIPNLFPNTNYLVKLDFNELYQNSVGSRVFNVSINGQQVLTNFDIYKSAGGKNKAIARQFLATSDATGKISLVFSTVVNNAMINGIELSQANSIQTYSLTGTVYTDTDQNGSQGTDETGYKGAIVTLDNGQSTTTDINGNYSFANLPTDIYTETLTLPTGYTATTTNPVSVTLNADTTQNFGIIQGNIDISAGGTGSGSFLSDQDFSGGQTYTTTNAVDTSAVTNPAPESVYQSVRFGNFSYTIPNLTPGSTYTVRLHFNELYWNSAGSRVFNVSINDSQVLTNFDIYQAAGGANKAVVEEFPATVDANGNITINFATVTDNAMVNGIELVH